MLLDTAGREPPHADVADARPSYYFVLKEPRQWRTRQLPAAGSDSVGSGEQSFPVTAVKQESRFQRVTNFHAATTTKMTIPTKYAQPRPFWSFS
jgi:hypothetical protein